MSQRVWAPILLVSVLFLEAIAVTSKGAIFTLPIFETECGNSEQLPLASTSFSTLTAIKGDCAMCLWRGGRTLVLVVNYCKMMIK